MIPIKLFHTKSTPMTSPDKTLLTPESLPRRNQKRRRKGERGSTADGPAAASPFPPAKRSLAEAPQKSSSSETLSSIRSTLVSTSSSALSCSEAMSSGSPRDTAMSAREVSLCIIRRVLGGGGGGGGGTCGRGGARKEKGSDAERGQIQAGS